MPRRSGGIAAWCGNRGPTAVAPELDAVARWSADRPIGAVVEKVERDALDDPWTAEVHRDRVASVRRADRRPAIGRQDVVPVVAIDEIRRRVQRIRVRDIGPREGVVSVVDGEIHELFRALARSVSRWQMCRDATELARACENAAIREDGEPRAPMIACTIPVPENREAMAVIDDVVQ